VGEPVQGESNKVPKKKFPNRERNALVTLASGQEKKPDEKKRGGG